MIWPEVAWLAAILVVPLFFSVYATAPFEAAKAQLVVSVAAASVVWLAASTIHRGTHSAYRARQPTIAGHAPRTTQRALPSTRQVPSFRRLTLGAMFLLALATVAATLTSVDPVRSLAGAPYRGQGTLFTLACLGIAISMVAGVRSRRQQDRIVLALLAPSIPVVVYALLQSGGWDVYPWQLEAGAPSYRVFGTLGHPSFLAAYLVMIVPLTAAEAIRCLFASHLSGDDGRWTGLFSGRWSPVVSGRTAEWAIGLLLLLLLAGQVTALLWAERRAGLLGLLAGGLTFALLSARLWLPRQKVSAGAIALLPAALVLAAAVTTPAAGRLADLSSDPYGTGTQRVLVWETAGHLLYDSPSRLLSGFGPSTLDLVMAGHRPPALDELVGDAPFDHTHSAAWEAVTTTGLFGLLAYIGLVFVVLSHGLMAMGLLPDGGAVRRALIGLFAGGGAGAGGLALAGGSWTLILPGGLLGAVAGLLGAAIVGTALKTAVHSPHAGAPFGGEPEGGVNAGRRRPAASPPAGGIEGGRTARPFSSPRNARQLLRLVALLSALAGYLVVSQFNIPDVTTTLLFWILASLVAVLGGEPLPVTATATGDGPEIGRQWLLVVLGATIPLTLLFDLSGLIGANPAPIWPAIALLTSGGVAAVLFVAGARAESAADTPASAPVRESRPYGGWSTGRT